MKHAEGQGALDGAFAACLSKLVRIVDPSGRRRARLSVHLNHRDSQTPASGDDGVGGRAAPMLRVRVAGEADLLRVEAQADNRGRDGSRRDPRPQNVRLVVEHQVGQAKRGGTGHQLVVLRVLGAQVEELTRADRRLVEEIEGIWTDVAVDSLPDRDHLDVAILTVPPMGKPHVDVDRLRTDPFQRFPLDVRSAPSLESLHLCHAWAALRPRGRAAVVVPVGVLFRGGSDKAVRDHLLEQDAIHAVIALPSWMWKHTSVQTAVVVSRTRRRLYARCSMQCRRGASCRP